MDCLLQKRARWLLAPFADPPSWLHAESTAATSARARDSDAGRRCYGSNVRVPARGGNSV